MPTSTLSFPYGEEINWLSPNHVQTPLNPSLHSWLLASDSLTLKLKEQCQHFEVKVLGEGMHTSCIGELPLQQTVWIREVLLCLDGQPWVFARTIIPEKLMIKKQADFLALGSKPLGELLFTKNEFVPGKIEIAKFSLSSRLAKFAASLDQHVSEPLWGRRRYFHVDSEQLIVSEVFLPTAKKNIIKMKQDQEAIL
ncbi:chorismate--pyruvate lyase family protein [Shewanella surugensis]|uniref:Probable chorismate pyruvate-lyase n=1 Tax=Shewanella surugensis TaxID=212020 RepID=A0ABT0L8K8_9GAMM|nr:chorismate lyase [Shewanella surugensis]MCL1124036.1 chorismate lyase [Shewanella surugensis]